MSRSVPSFGSSNNVTINGYPNQCPYCHKAITPLAIYGNTIDQGHLEIFMRCPDDSCKRGFVAYYRPTPLEGWTTDGTTSRGTIVGKAFSEHVRSISKSFEEIYNQAYASEQLFLLEICGVGYRKAVEFLIKDYAIIKHPDEREKIEGKLLGKCIDDYVNDERIKKVAKRAVWLGNDETHYIKKWEGKNLEDLKRLIDLTVHWIEMESLTEEFETEMPS